MVPVCSREVTFPWYGSTHCCLCDVRLGSLITSFLHAGMCAKEAVLWGTWWSFGMLNGMLGCKARDFCSAPKSLINLILFFSPCLPFFSACWAAGGIPQSSLQKKVSQVWQDRMGEAGMQEGECLGSFILILVLIPEPAGLAAEPSFDRRGTKWEQKYRDVDRSSPAAAGDSPISAGGHSYLLTAALGALTVLGFVFSYQESPSGSWCWSSLRISWSASF